MLIIVLVCRDIVEMVTQIVLNQKNVTTLILTVVAPTHNVDSVQVLKYTDVNALLDILVKGKTVFSINNQHLKKRAMSIVTFVTQKLVV